MKADRWTGFLLAVFLAGCAGTFSDVKPQMTAVSLTERPTTLVVGEIRASDATWERYRADLVKGIVDWFKKNGGIETVLTAPDATPPGNSVVVVGTITEIDKGSAALRVLVGMGAGQAKAKGEFELRRPDGMTLTKFTARRSYLGGVGIGGAGLLDMEQLVGRLGETIAETTSKWLRGEKIE